MIQKTLHLGSITGRKPVSPRCQLIHFVYFQDTEKFPRAGRHMKQLEGYSETLCLETYCDLTFPPSATPHICRTHLSQHSQPFYTTVHCHLQSNPAHARSWLHDPSTHLQLQSPACHKRRQPRIAQCKTTSLSRSCFHGVLLQEKEKTCKQKHFLTTSLPL